MPGSTSGCNYDRCVHSLDAIEIARYARPSSVVGCNTHFWRAAAEACIKTFANLCWLSTRRSIEIKITAASSSERNLGRFTAPSRTPSVAVSRTALASQSATTTRNDPVRQESDLRGESRLRSGRLRWDGRQVPVRRKCVPHPGGLVPLQFRRR